MLRGLRVAWKVPRVPMTSLDEPAPLTMRDVAALRAPGAASGLERLIRATPWAVCAITAVAAALRFAEVDQVSANQFYDAAVRSMAMSWHNLFFGAFDPSAMLAVDKPPLDLWLQVASVKVLGWNAAALKLPEALGGTIAVPLLYDAVRRAVGKPAALGAAMALAVLPVSVLTSRSDTMDSVMMLMVVAALWLTIRASISGSRRAVVLTGVVLGLAFNVKLLEALIPVPALLVLYVLASPLSWRRKAADVLLAGAALVWVGLSWILAVSIAPGSHPIPVGSTDGTVWNVVFVFNGFSRVGAASAPYRGGGPGALRLFEGSSWHFDVLIGCVLVAALAIGVAAVALALRHRVRDGSNERLRMARAFAVAVIVWIGVAVALFSHVPTLHPRYLEALAPALAAAIGYGVAVIAGLTTWRGRLGRPSVLVTTIALACICAYTFGLEPSAIAWSAVSMSVAAVGATLLASAGGAIGRAAGWLTAALVLSCALLFPVHESLMLVRSNANDSRGLATHSMAIESALWRYLEPRTVGTKYELAVDEPLALAPLIIHDQRPILPLTSFHGLPVVGLGKLKAAVRSGAVRYGLVGAYACGPHNRNWASCGPAAQWIRHTGLDVSSAAGLVGASRLYLLLPF